MSRQLLIWLFAHFLFFQNAYAVPPTNQVLTVPSDEANPNPEKKDADKSFDVIQDQGLEQTSESSAFQYPSFHLKPSPSFTVQASGAYDFEAEDTHTWIGVHLAPWMGPTHRIQLGLDVYDRYGWIHAAYHVLPQRTGRRWYWGGGVSALMNSREEFRPLLKFKNYFAFAVGGIDLQIMPQHSLRFEASYHQSTEFSFVRGTVGFTTYF